MLPRAFRRSAPLTFGEGAFPLANKGMEIPALPAPCENRGGGALPVCCVSAGCLKCESEIPLGAGEESTSRVNAITRALKLRPVARPFERRAGAVDRALVPVFADQ